MSKQIEFGSEAREKLLAGITKLADAVTATMGPNGRNVIFNDPMNGIRSTKDGVSVAKEISLEDKIEDLGAQMVKQTAIKTADIAGDGTTTSTLLASELIKEGIKGLNNGRNAVQIKRGIDSAVKEVINTIKTNIKENITSEEQLKQIAAISANNDVEVGNLIAAAFEKVGKEGVVSVEESKTHETTLEVVEGMQFDRGYKSPYFVTDNNTMQSNLDDPYILLYDGKINTAKEILKILEACSSQNKSLLIVAEDIDQEALAVMIVNKMRGTLKCCAVKAPDFGERRTHILEDLAVITGGTVLSKQKGHRLDKLTFDMLGTARGVSVGKEKTTIVDGKGTEEEIGARLEEIKSQIDRAETPFAVEKLQERLAKMSGGVAIINVGGHTETEMKEKKDRVEDAMHATRAAIDEGIVPGGGIALLYGKGSIECNGDNHEDFSFGKQVVLNALSAPFTKILTNAGTESNEASYLIYKLIDSGNDYWAGYNVDTKEVINMKESGIIDPFKVTRIALESAASVAGTVLLTEAAVIDTPKEDDDSAGAGDLMSQMGMM
jgi:chaperonin GroEL